MGRWVFWLGAVAVAIACGDLQAGSASSEADAAVPDDPPAAPATDAGCDGHAFCEGFDQKLPDGRPDLSRWPNQLGANTLTLTDASVTTPPFALQLTADALSPPVRSMLAAGLPTPTTRAHCSFDARFAATPKATPIRVLQLRLLAGNKTSFFMVYGTPTQAQLGIHEEMPDASPTFDLLARDGDMNPSSGLVSFDLVITFPDGGTRADLKVGTLLPLTIEHAGAADAAALEVDVGLTNNTLPDAGPVDVRLDSIVCDVE